MTAEAWERLALYQTALRKSRGAFVAALSLYVNDRSYEQAVQALCDDLYALLVVSKPPKAAGARDGES